MIGNNKDKVKFTKSAAKISIQTKQEQLRKSMTQVTALKLFWEYKIIKLYWQRKMYVKRELNHFHECRKLS